MGTILFGTQMFGGHGDLQISFDRSADILTFNQTTAHALPVDLPQGVNNYTVAGAAANGPGGNIHLVIKGDVLPVTPQDFGPGVILNQTFPCFVTT
jgi:hypothetical protein